MLLCGLVLAWTRWRAVAANQHPDTLARLVACCPCRVAVHQTACSPSSHGRTAVESHTRMQRRDNDTAGVMLHSDDGMHD